MFTPRAMLTALALFVATPAMARPAVTELEIDNDHYQSVNVEVDNRMIGTVGARGSRTFSVPPGHHEVEITTSDGRRVVDTRVHLHRGEHEEIEVQALARPMLLTNPTRLDMRVTVRGRTYELDAGRRLELFVDERYVNIDVEAKAFGTWFDVGEERVRLDDREQARVVLGSGAHIGFLKVDNDTWEDAVLVIDGRRQGWVREDGVFALSLPAGRHEVALEIDGRVVESKSVLLSSLEVERISLDGREYYSYYRGHRHDHRHGDRTHERNDRDDGYVDGGDARRDDGNRADDRDRDRDDRDRSRR